MTCHTDDCTIVFVAWCPKCGYRGAVRETVREAVNDCTEHNRKQRHVQGVHGSARVLAEHVHQPLAGVTS